MVDLMNKTAIIGAVIVLLIVIVAAAYFIGSKGTTPYLYSSTTAATTISTTTVGGAYSTMPTTTIPVNASGTNAYTVDIRNSSTVGTYLVNRDGFTLYTFKADIPNTNVSACTSTCAADWPPFYSANLTFAPGLNASAFGTITRVGGAKQLTYNGWPLYLFIGDNQAGEVSGNGVGDFQVAAK